MWGPWLTKFGIRRPHIVEDNITLNEIVAMWDALQESSK